MVAVTNTAKRLAPMMSSKKHDWRTPSEVLDVVRQVGPIGLDPCGHPESLVGARREYRLDRKENGLRLPWNTTGGELVFVNPPYGRLLDRWASACCAVGRERVAPVILLMPSRTDTSTWHDFIAPLEHGGADVVCFWRGRITFVGAPGCSPFPCAFAGWGDADFVARFRQVFDAHGGAVDGVMSKPAFCAHWLSHRRKK